MTFRSNQIVERYALYANLKAAIVTTEYFAAVKVLNLLLLAASCVRLRIFQVRVAVSDTTKSPLQLCSGHSLAMCCAVCFATLRSHDADGDVHVGLNEEPKLSLAHLCMCYYYISLHNNREIYVPSASTS